MPPLEAGENRGYTDQFTGAMHLLDIPANALFKFLLKGRLPSVFLPSFLHEATHFWCMSTDLGAVLALREMRMHRAMMDGPVDGSHILRDVSALEVVRQLLRPLLEGMALFQEFDAMPGESRVLSTPGYWAARLFMPLDEDTPQIKDPSKWRQWITDEVRRTMIGYRVQDVAYHRKMRVLMGSLSHDPHHYLAGYLAVKRIWINAFHRTPALFDRDLFISFLRAWVFQDWELIRYICDETISCEVLTYLASERLQARLVELGATNLSAEVDVYDSETDSKEPDAERLLWSLKTPLWVARDAQERMRVQVDKIRTGLKDGERKNWYFADVVILRHRQGMMRLAKEEVEIEVNEHNRVLIRKGESFESTYMAGTAPPQAERGITKGWVTVYFLPEHLAVIVLAMRDNQPMMWLEPEGIPENDLTIFRFAATKVAATEESRRGLTKIGRELVAQLDDKEYVRMLERLPAHVLEVYTHYALSLTPGDRVKQIEELLARKGLYDVLGKNGDLLAALVKISLIPPLVELSKDILAEVLGETEINPNSALEELLQVQDATGMHLLAGEGDYIWSTV